MQPDNNMGMQSMGTMSGFGSTSDGMNGSMQATSFQRSYGTPNANGAFSQNGAEKKSGKGMLLGMIISVILAVGGIGFGVWAMIDRGNMESEIEDLEEQIAFLQEELGDTDDGDDDYIPEWGTATAKLDDGVFYVFDSHDDMVAVDDSVEATKLLDCDYGNKNLGTHLVCTVMTKNGEGEYTYDYNDGSLEFDYLEYIADDDEEEEEE